MFAKSTSEKDVGQKLIPLFAKHTPLPATTHFNASAEVKQYQVVLVNLADSTVAPATEAAPLERGKILAVAAYAGKTGESISVYTHGTVNVHALELSAIASVAGKDAAGKVKELNKFASQAIFFDNAWVDTMYHV